MATLRRILLSRYALLLGVAVTLIVPATTLSHLPRVSVWPLIIGSAPWLIAEYLLCALRWRTLTTHLAQAPGGHAWYLRANAESELLGLLTPGHVGADVWRLKRLTHAGVPRADALLSVGSDRVVGVVGVAAFIVFAAPGLPVRYLAIGGAIGVGLVLAAVLGRRFWPRLLPGGALPRPRAFVKALFLATVYQLTVACMLLGTLHATGHSLSPLQLLAAFGASQAAGAIPGPTGASPGEGALVLALVALGIPLTAAAAAVTLKAALAWVPAFLLGGIPLLMHRSARPATA